MVFHLLKALKLFLNCLPLPVAVGLGHGIGGFIGRFFGRELKIANSQIRVAAKQPCAANTRLGSFLGNEISLALKSFAHVGEAAAELMVIEQILRPKVPGATQLYETNSFAHIECSGFEEVLSHTKRGQPIMALSAHLGCFDILSAASARLGMPLTIFGRTANYSSIARFVDYARTGYGIQMLWREDPKASQKLASAIKEKRSFAALIDQDTALENIFTPFFGLEAAHPIRPVQIAVKFEMPIFFAYVVRTSTLKFLIRAVPIYYSADDKAASEKILQEYSRLLEEVLCEHPEQWLWWHRRWRRRPGVDYNATPDALLKTNAYIQWLDEQGLAQQQPDQHAESVKGLA